MTMTTLLVDGDVVAYRIAVSIERPIHWGDDLWTLHADAGEGIQALDQWMSRMQEELGASDVVVALSDSSDNWRFDVWPSYKAHRKGIRKPICLARMRQHFADAYHTVSRPRLEGDDVLGILATHPDFIPGRKIIVSVDKDFFSIPGEFAKVGVDGSVTLHQVSQEQADRFHLIQTLAGDASDGYPGCPGVGHQKAEALLAGGRVLVPREYTVSRGARRGETEIRWEEGPPGSPWEIVVSAYARAGLTEEDALIQARVARILRATDYDFNLNKPILWRP
jgi:DNA polymerase-1